jgi:hypothetical protein
VAGWIDHQPLLIRLPSRFVANLFRSYGVWLAIPGFIGVVAGNLNSLLGLFGIGPVSLSVPPTLGSFLGSLGLLVLIALSIRSIYQVGWDEHEASTKKGGGRRLAAVLGVEEWVGTFQPSGRPYAFPSSRLAFRCTNSDHQSVRKCRARLDSLVIVDDGGSAKQPDWFTPVILLWEDGKNEAEVGPLTSELCEFVALDSKYGLVAVIKHGGDYKTWHLTPGHWQAAVTWTAKDAIPLKKKFHVSCKDQGPNKAPLLAFEKVEPVF